MRRDATLFSIFPVERVRNALAFLEAKHRACKQRASRRINVEQRIALANNAPRLTLSRGLTTAALLVARQWRSSVALVAGARRAPRPQQRPDRVETSARAGGPPSTRAHSPRAAHPLPAERTSLTTSLILPSRARTPRPAPGSIPWLAAPPRKNAVGTPAIAPKRVLPEGVSRVSF